MDRLPSPVSSRNWLLTLLAFLITASVATWVYQPVFKAPLAFDDAHATAFVAKFASWTDAWGIDAYGFFRPVKNLYFHIIQTQAGGTLNVYHAVNLAAFVLAGLSVQGLIQRIIGSPWAALGGGLIWVLSPTCGTIAIWASCFNINAAIITMCLAVVTYDVARSGGRFARPAGVAAALLVVMSLLCYESAVAIAPLFVLLDLHRGRIIFSRRSIAIYAALAVAVIGFIALRHLFGAPAIRSQNPSVPPEMPWWQLTLSSPYFLWTHFQMWVAPTGRLEMMGSYLWDKSIPKVILPFCWIFLLGLAFLGAKFRERAPVFILGLAWFVIASLPSGNLIPFRNTPYADYYVPIPSIGLALSLSAVLLSAGKFLRARRGRKEQRWAVAAAVLLIVAWRGSQLPALTDWLRAWEAPVQIVARTAAARPHQYLANSLTAYMLATSAGEKPEEILQSIEHHATQAVADRPDLGTALAALGEAARLRGDAESALDLFRRSLAAKHTQIDSQLWCHQQIVRILMENPDNFDLTQKHLLILLRQRNRPSHPRYVLLAAEAMKAAGKPELELQTLEKGHGYHPQHAGISAALEEAKQRKDAAPSP